MTEAEVREAAATGESQVVEFKASTAQKKEAAKTACGMLNTQGGLVLIGVRDDGELVGQDVSARTLETLVTELRKIDPPALLTPECVQLANGRTVIVIHIPGNPVGTFAHDGRSFVRQGPTTRVMPREELRRRVLRQSNPAQRWENLPSDVPIAALDHAEITRTIDEGIRRGRMDEPGTRDPEALLRGLGLMRAEQVLNAAVVVFGRPEAFTSDYSQCLLRLARFRGKDKTEFEDNRQLTGNLFALLAAAQRFLRERLPVTGRVVPGLFEREDDPLYPPSALREALANAFCHRDYSIPGGSVSAAVYDDRLEITSTGTLPSGLTPGDLLRPHTSQPPNPVIASVLYRRGLIEQWGRGTIKIAELTQQAGLAIPEFEQRGGEVVVRFLPTGYVPPPLAPHELTPLQRQILEILGEVGPAPSTAIRPHLSGEFSEHAVLMNLRLLVHLGLVEKIGRTRDTRWQLTGLRPH